MNISSVMMSMAQSVRQPVRFSSGNDPKPVTKQLPPEAQKPAQKTTSIKDEAILAFKRAAHMAGVNLDAANLLLQGKLPQSKPAKIGIIGAGNVGASLAQTMAQEELAKTIALVDIKSDVAKGKAQDIQDACPVYNSDTQLIGDSDYKIIEGADIVVVTAGLPRRPDMTREDLLEANTRIVADASRKIKKHAPNATIIMVSNPLDVMCHVAKEVTGFPPERIIGMAGVLDSARFRAEIANELQVSVEDVQAMVLGGHGDSMVPLPRYTTVSGIPITKLMDAQTIERLVHNTRNGGGRIVNYLGTSSYIAAGASIADMVKSMLKDKNMVAPCSTYLQGKYGQKGLYVGVPVKLGKDGIKEVIQLDLTPEEQKLFNASAQIVKENVDKLPAILAKIEQEELAKK